MAESSDRRSDGILAAIFAAGAILRFSTWRHVFDGGRVFIDEPDGYYHLRRAWLILQQWPRVPQWDPWLNAPAGGRISWPPLFDWLLATLVLPWRRDPSHALEVAGALLPPLLGCVQLGAIYLMTRTLATRRAAVIATLVAAVLPAAVRYTLVGTLDHDPLYELAVITSLWSIAREMRARSRGNIALLAASLTVAFLSWTGALVLAAILGAVIAALFFASRELMTAAARLTAFASAAASILILPFVLSSTWTAVERATFEGLSLLHVAVLLLLAGSSGFLAVFLGGTRERSLIAIAVLAAAGTLLLAPIAAAPLAAGARYAAGDAAILRTVAEAQPLLKLFGRFDLAPMLIRLSILPLIALVVLPAEVAQRRSTGAAAGAAWLLVTFTLALLHSRFSYSAALATALASGIVFDRLLERHAAPRVAMLGFLVALPTLTAYVPVPGWDAFNFYRRGNAMRELGADAICERLRARPIGVVFAPWWFGHWAIWSAQKPVVQSPMLSVGQSQFAAASRFYFETDEAKALSALDGWNARYVVVTQRREDLEALGAAAGRDASRYVVRDPGGARRIDLPQYLETVPARLALWGSGELRAFGRVYPAIPRLREIDRTAEQMQGPLGPVPFVRVFEVVR